MNNRLRGVALFGSAVLAGTLGVSVCLGSKAADAAKAHYDRGEYKEAEAGFREALRRDPDDDAAAIGMFATLLKVGTEEEAQPYYRMYEDIVKRREAKAAATPGAGPPAVAPAAPPRPAQPPPAQPPRAQPAPAAARPAKASAISWWAKTEIARTGNLTCTYYCFGPDGFVYNGPLNATASSPEDLKRLDPKHVGKATVNGSEATFQFPGAAAEVHKLGGGTIDNSPLQSVTPVAAGATLDGRYTVLNVSTSGGVQAVGAGIWTFRPDGTFTHELLGAVESTPHVAGTGDAPAQARGKSEQITRGRYSFDNGTLSLTGEAGAAETHTVWSIGGKSPPWYIDLDGLVFKLAS